MIIIMVNLTNEQKDSDSGGLSDYSQTTLKLLSDFSQTTLRLLSDYSQITYRLHAQTLRLHHKLAMIRSIEY